PRGTAATRCGAGSASTIGRSSGVSRACASSSVRCRAKVRGSTRLNRNGSMASGPCRKRIDCSALLNSKRGSMPTIAVSVKSISSCQKRSLAYALVRNYLELFGSGLTYRLYLNTLQYAAVVWALTLIIGWTVAYFLVFHVRTMLWRMALFLLCTVPFWTSNIIRMIAWIPFLGLNGIFNQS